MTEEKKQALASKIVDEIMIPEVQAMIDEARKAGRSEANERIRLALFHLDEDDPVKASVARAIEILRGVLAEETR